MPECYSYLWEWFRDLAAVRERDSRGRFLPLTYAALTTWSGFSGIRLRRREAAMLKAIDGVLMEVINDH